MGFALSAGLIAWLLWRVDWTTTAHAIRHAHPGPYLLALAFMFGQFAISSMKWDLLLRHKNIRIGYFKLYRAYMVGAFISSFLPSRYSGDLYRGFVVARESGRAYDSAAAVLLERAIGLFVLAATGLAASLYWAVQLGDYSVPLAVAAALGGLVLLLASLFSRRVFAAVSAGLRLARLDALVGPAGKFHAAIIAYRRQPALFARVMGLAALFYIESFAIMYFLLIAVGAHAPFVYLAVVVPVVYLVEALPLSVNGLGLREGTFFFFLSRIGISPEQIVAFSVLVLVNRTLANLSGGAFLLTHPSEWTLWKRNEARPGSVAAA